METRRGLLRWDTRTQTELRIKKRIEKPSGMYVCSVSLKQKQKKVKKEGEKKKPEAAYECKSGRQARNERGERRRRRESGEEEEEGE